VSTIDGGHLDQQKPSRQCRFTKRVHYIPVVFMPLETSELLSNLVFEVFGSCSDLVWVCGLNSVFECDAGDDFGQVIKAA
jgi:hypothetical protein